MISLITYYWSSKYHLQHQPSLKTVSINYHNYQIKPGIKIPRKSLITPVDPSIILITARFASSILITIPPFNRPTCREPKSVKKALSRSFRLKTFFLFFLLRFGKFNRKKINKKTIHFNYSINPIMLIFICATYVSCILILTYTHIAERSSIDRSTFISVCII